MGKFKVGDRVKFVGGCSDGEYAKITGFTIVEGQPGIKFTTDDGHECSELQSKAKLVVTALDHLSVGDVLVNEYGDEYTVIGVLGEIVFLADEDGHASDYFTAKELKDNDWTIKTDDSAITEMTLPEVAKLAGIPVEQLRIRK